MMPPAPIREVYVSVDVETAGPNPGLYSLLSIGACLVAEPERTFYIELQPVNSNAEKEALAVHGLSLEKLRVAGVPPADAMAQFEAWLAREIPPPVRPLFVAFNAPFDWMFVNDYFHRFLGRNPFGHNAIDVKAYYMGLSGSYWADTSLDKLLPRYVGPAKLTHNALDDAKDQAAIFRVLLEEAARRRLPAE
ncbi:MAG TPA: 3'-5' exonuclease [Chloroflexia bacterium]|nr:3'-5' exonuclease [Chloroflexia bacterium]